MCVCVCVCLFLCVRVCGEQTGIISIVWVAERENKETFLRQQSGKFN
jgi:hypothetical protein